MTEQADLVILESSLERLHFIGSQMEEGFKYICLSKRFWTKFQKVAQSSAEKVIQCYMKFCRRQSCACWKG